MTSIFLPLRLIKKCSMECFLDQFLGEKKFPNKTQKIWFYSVFLGSWWNTSGSRWCQESFWWPTWTPRAWSGKTPTARSCCWKPWGTTCCPSRGPPCPRTGRPRGGRTAWNRICLHLVRNRWSGLIDCLFININWPKNPVKDEQCSCRIRVKAVHGFCNSIIMVPVCCYMSKESSCLPLHFVVVSQASLLLLLLLLLRPLFLVSFQAIVWNNSS